MFLFLFLPLIALHGPPKMAFLTSNRLLIIGLSIGIGTAYVAVNALLQDVKDAAKAPVPEPPPPAKNLQKDSENSLKIETLRTLADGYSYDLRGSAIKIVATRTARSQARVLLLRDLASKNYERRENALKAMFMLLTHTALAPSVTDQFRDAKSTAAVVKGLVNVLPQHKIGHKAQNQAQAQGENVPLPPSPIRPSNRPSQEASLLNLLGNMVPYRNRHSLQYRTNVEAALRAGLVTNWLAHYPFPCSLPENSHCNYKRADVARLFDQTAWKSDDLAMETIIFAVTNNPMGRKQMRLVGLIGSNMRENVNVDHREREPWNWGSSAWVDGDGATEDEDRDIRMVNGEDTAGLIPVPGAWDEPAGLPTTRAGARLRSAERSQEEEHLRRRHREAIVVAERGAPLTRENILQREDSQILQPMNGVSDVEGELNGLLGLSEFSRIDPFRQVEDSEPIHDHVDRLVWPVALDPVAEAEVDRELYAMEEEAQAQELDRAQRRQHEMEQSIGQDLEIQGTADTVDQMDRALYGSADARRQSPGS